MSGKLAGGTPGFYVAMALLGLAVALAGFSKTFFAPVVAGTFEAPLIVHLHGVAAFAWVLLFLLQPTLIRTGRFDVHVRTGAIGPLLALTVAATAIPGGYMSSSATLPPDWGQPRLPACWRWSRP